MKHRRKTFKINSKAQRNMEMDIQSISGGSRKRNTCKCKVCGKIIKYSKSMKCGKCMKKSRKMRR
jgi:hypothetical protein